MRAEEGEPGNEATNCLPIRRGTCSNTNSFVAGRDGESERGGEGEVVGMGESEAGGGGVRSHREPSSPQRCIVSAAATNCAPVTPDANPSHAPPIPDLPAPSPLAQAHFTWGSSEVSSEQFIRSVNAAYSEVVH